jgi:butyryl-CoA dehydrogenase
MDYFFTPTQLRLKGIAQKIVKEEILPQAIELDRHHSFPLHILTRLAHEGMFKIFIPKEYGGTSTGIMDLCLVVEELARGCAGVATSYAATALASTPIILFGNEEQKKKYLPQIAKGSLASFALTEPDAGSDAGGIKTEAKKEGNCYVLTGRKQWITNGSEASIYVVFASTRPERGARGLSAFIIEKGVEGFSIGKIEDKLGIQSSLTAELVFEGVKVPEENLIYKEGMGFLIAMKTFDYTRPGVGALATGVAQGVLDEVERHKKEVNFEEIQFFIAELRAKVEASRALTYAVARYADKEGKNISTWSAMSKLFAGDTAMEVTSKVVELLKLKGCTQHYLVEKMLRDAKITQIYEGTNEIQKSIIGRALTKQWM